MGLLEGSRRDPPARKGPGHPVRTVRFWGSCLPLDWLGAVGSVASRYATACAAFSPFHASLSSPLLSACFTTPPHPSASPLPCPGQENLQWKILGCCLP